MTLFSTVQVKIELERGSSIQSLHWIAYWNDTFSQHWISSLHDSSYAGTLLERRLYQLQTSAGVDHWTGLERHWTNANSASRGGENLLQSSATGETKNVNHLSMNDGEEFVKLLIDTGGWRQLFKKSLNYCRFLLGISVEVSTISQMVLNTHVTFYTKYLRRNDVIVIDDCQNRNIANSEKRRRNSATFERSGKI